MTTDHPIYHARNDTSQSPPKGERKPNIADPLVVKKALQGPAINDSDHTPRHGVVNVQTLKKLLKSGPQM